MQTKICFKCGRELPLDAFYAHPQMKDGHLNKCKECTKKDVKQNYLIKSSDENEMERQRARGREKYARLHYRGRYNKYNILRKASSSISQKLKRLGIDTKGKEAHHWNYNKVNSVFLVSRKAHKRIHQHLTINYNDNFCYTEDDMRLVSPDQASAYFSSILARYGIQERLELINL